MSGLWSGRVARVTILDSNEKLIELEQSAMDQMRENSVLYFAYGSNMLTERLHKRCPNARPLGNAVAHGFSLRFCKRSKDGSAKATLVKTDEREQPAYGVLFELSQSEQARLDKSEGEGLGYDRDDAFTVFRLADGEEAIASTYRASRQACDEGLIPYDWYRALILAGAFQHGLPDTYIAELRRTIVWSDPQPQRHSRQEALDVLKCVGFHPLQQPP